jgi:hypothetical protein
VPIGVELKRRGHRAVLVANEHFQPVASFSLRQWSATVPL